MRPKASESLYCAQFKSLPALLYVGGTGDFLGGLIAFIVCAVKVQASLSFKANAKKEKRK
jgi:NAD(P)H-hydrate repair Nnr-like enzyme with NAD(P)H-hydrate dehydratase domain